MLLLPPGWKDWESAMRLALAQARLGADLGEVPVGAVLLSPEGEVLAEACNRPVTDHDPSAHAEMLALRRGAERQGNYRLADCVLVCTLEPCLMCLGAMLHARIGGLVFGARDPKAGALVSRMDGADLPFANHRFPYLDGILAEECGDILQDFFRSRRSA
ncbi:tRNA adenosine(34) deaminase TadA [Desulfocurvus sp. DL9XJH121]